MPKQRFISRTKQDKFIPEEIEWLRLTPGERFHQTTKLWQFYLIAGGKLDPEPDPQSPFYFQEI